MGFVVRLEDYTPGQRDDQPWTEARIYEGPNRDGPWALIDTFALDPVDADPTAPATRDFTTTEALNEADWFQVQFRDAGGNVQAAPAVYFPNPQMQPLPADVGHLLWARTKDSGGNTSGVFSADTRPTATQVEEFIAIAVSDVVTRVGPIPERAWGLAREAATIRAAMLVELSFRPEQARDSESAYGLLRNEWLDLVGGGVSGYTGRLTESISDAGVGASALQSVPCRSIMAEDDDWALRQVVNLNE